MKILILILSLAAATALVYLAYRLEQRRKKYINGVRKFSEANRRFDGTVTSRGKGSIMLKFRDDELKKTIHHRYSFSGKRYKKDAPVVIFYDEQNDSALVEGDNPFVRGAVRCAVLSAVCVVSAVGMVVFGIVNMF